MIWILLLQNLLSSFNAPKNKQGRIYYLRSRFTPLLSVEKCFGLQSSLERLDMFTGARRHSHRYVEYWIFWFSQGVRPSILFDVPLVWFSLAIILAFWECYEERLSNYLLGICRWSLVLRTWKLTMQFVRLWILFLKIRNIRSKEMICPYIYLA